MYTAYTDKLLNFADQNAANLSKKWIAMLKSNPKTPSYKKTSDYKLEGMGENFYRSMAKLYFEQKSYDVLTAYFKKYAEEQYYETIPLEEAIYGIVLLRRQIWISAESEVLFSTSLDQYQAAESINKTVLLTDHATHTIINRYGELRK